MQQLTLTGKIKCSPENKQTSKGKNYWLFEMECVNDFGPNYKEKVIYTCITFSEENFSKTKGESTAVLSGLFFPRLIVKENNKPRICLIVIDQYNYVEDNIIEYDVQEIIETICSR